MPDDHSDLVPLLPIPNRTVKRVSADDSADSRVKVGHRQAITARKSPVYDGAFFCLFLAALRCHPTHGDLRHYLAALGYLLSELLKQVTRDASAATALLSLSVFSQPVSRKRIVERNS